MGVKTLPLIVIVLVIIAMGCMAGSSLFIEGDNLGGASVSSSVIECQNMQLGIIMLILMVMVFGTCKLKDRMFCYN